MTASKAADNARRIREISEAGEGYVDLYRTIIAGPSGQRADLLVGRVRWLDSGPDDLMVIGPDGDRYGYARWDPTGPSGRLWSMTAEDYDGSLHWLGWASSLAVGVDVLINGEYAALGRYDSRRISSGSITRKRTP